MRLSELTTATNPNYSDLIPFVDVSDISQSSGGSTRKMTLANLTGYFLSPTGTADNVAIQAALNALDAVGGGRLYLKAGIYGIAANITIPSNIEIYGDGKATILSLTANVTVFVNSDIINGNNNITIRDMKLIGYSAIYTSGISGIVLTKCENSRIENCFITDFKGNCLALTNCLNTYVIKNKLTYAGSLGHGFKTSGSISGYNQDLFINDNYISNCTNNGMELTATQFSNFNRNKIWTNTKNGISGYRIYKCTFNENVANDNTWSGIDIEGARNCVFANGIYNNNTLNGLGVERNYSDDIKSQFCAFIGNEASNNGRSGFFAQNADYILVIGNTGENNSRLTSGIGAFFQAYFESSDHSRYCTHLIISNNVYADTRGTSLSTYGITESGTAGVDYSMANSSVFGNDMSGLLTSAIRVIGSNNKVRNNTGYTTEASGTATINSGATSTTITHGLSVTPTLKDISIIFGEQGTNDYGRFWISSITSTQFTINVSADPGASNLDLAWRAIVL
jgi:parallel beta-helix repeat protein